MGTETDNLEILIPDGDAPETPVVTETPPPASAATAETPPVVDPEVGLQKLKSDLAAEAAARRRAEAEAREARQAAQTARGEVAATELNLVATAISNVTQQMEIQEQQYAAALAGQDYALASKINREMTVNAGKLAQLDQAKSAMERQAKAPPPVISRPDPVEEFASRCTPASAAWVRAHPEYVTDARKNQRMIGAHNIALADGYEPDSKEYFEAIEATLRITHPTPSTDVRIADDPPPAPKRQSAPPAAPVSRSGGSGSNGKGRTVTLTRAQAEAAEASGLTLEEYAKNLEALKAAGRIN